MIGQFFRTCTTGRQFFSPIFLKDLQNQKVRIIAFEGGGANLLHELHFLNFIEKKSITLCSLFSFHSSSLGT